MKITRREVGECDRVTGRENGGEDPKPGSERMSRRAGRWLPAHGFRPFRIAASDHTKNRQTKGWVPKRPTAPPSPRARASHQMTAIKRRRIPGKRQGAMNDPEARKRERRQKTQRSRARLRPNRTLPGSAYASLSISPGSPPPTPLEPHPAWEPVATMTRQGAVRLQMPQGWFLSGPKAYCQQGIRRPGWPQPRWR
jgi:hypothetical protein